MRTHVTGSNNRAGCSSGGREVRPSNRWVESPAACFSILDQDTEPQIAPAPAPCMAVSGCVCECDMLRIERSVDLKSAPEMQVHLQ